MKRLDAAAALGSDDLAQEWNALAASQGSSYFQTHDWCSAWWSTVGGQPSGQMALWHDHFGRLEAVVGLVETKLTVHSRLPWRARAVTLPGAGIGAADHVGFPVESHRLGDVADWLAEAAGDRTMWLPNLDSRFGETLPPEAEAVDETVCPRLEIPDDRQFGSSKLRKQIRAYRRKVADAGIELRAIEPGQITPHDVDVLLDLHAARSDSAGRRTSFDESKRALHLELARRANPQRGPAMVVAETSERPVGALYGFWFGETFSYYQSGWEPATSAINLGTVLVAEALEVAADRGARFFDFLRGPERYKYRFGAHDVVETSWIVPHGLGGRLYQAGVRLKQRVDAAATD